MSVLELAPVDIACILERDRCEVGHGFAGAALGNAENILCDRCIIAIGIQIYLRTGKPLFREAVAVDCLIDRHAGIVIHHSQHTFFRLDPAPSAGHHIKTVGDIQVIVIIHIEHDRICFLVAFRNCGFTDPIEIGRCIVPAQSAAGQDVLINRPCVAAALHADLVIPKAVCLFQRQLQLIASDQIAAGIHLLDGHTGIVGDGVLPTGRNNCGEYPAGIVIFHNRIRQSGGIVRKLPGAVILPLHYIGVASNLAGLLDNQVFIRSECVFHCRTDRFLCRLFCRLSTGCLRIGGNADCNREHLIPGLFRILFVGLGHIKIVPFIRNRVPIRCLHFSDVVAASYVTCSIRFVAADRKYDLTVFVCNQRIDQLILRIACHLPVQSDLRTSKGLVSEYLGQGYIICQIRSQQGDRACEGTISKFGITLEALGDQCTRKMTGLDIIGFAIRHIGIRCKKCALCTSAAIDHSGSIRKVVQDPVYIRIVIVPAGDLAFKPVECRTRFTCICLECISECIRLITGYRSQSTIVHALVLAPVIAVILGKFNSNTREIERFTIFVGIIALRDALPVDQRKPVSVVTRDRVQNDLLTLNRNDDISILRNFLKVKYLTFGNLIPFICGKMQIYNVAAGFFTIEYNLAFDARGSERALHGSVVLIAGLCKVRDYDPIIDL